MSTLWWIVGITGYLLLGIFILVFIKKLSDDSIEMDDIDVLAILFWPVIVVFFVIVGLVSIPVKLASLLANAVKNKRGE